MQPTGVYSLALVATAAALFSSAEAHGQMTMPLPRTVTAKFRKDSGALKNAGDQELEIAPIELLSQRKQADFPTAKTFNIMNGCRGFVYEEGVSDVTTLTAGADFDVKWWIQAPHPGYMTLSVVKPSTDASGKITYKKYKELKTIEPFAETGGDSSTTATMASDIEGCGSPGDCALQFYWHSDIADQTYPTCADIVVSGSGAGTGATTPTTPASSTDEDEASADEDEASAAEETEAPAATTAPPTATKAPTEAPAAGSTAGEAVKCTARRALRK